jgi:hypothetical protein
VLIPPDGTMREGKRPGWEHGFYEKMRRKLQTMTVSGQQSRRRVRDGGGSQSTRSTAFGRRPSSDDRMHPIAMRFGCAD